MKTYLDWDLYVVFLMNVFELFMIWVFELFFIKSFMFCVNFKLCFCFSWSLCFGLVFRSNFSSVYDWINIFRSIHLILFWIKYLKLCLFEQFFVKDFFYLRGCLGNISLSLFWQFSREKKSFAKQNLTEINNKKIIFTRYIIPILIKIIFYL